MKKFVQNIWMRLIACLLCAISVLGIAVAAAGVFFFGMYPDKDAVLEEGNTYIMQNYALYAADYFDILEEEGLFDTINAYITIERHEYLSEEDSAPVITGRYSNMPEGTEPSYELEKLYVGAEKYYSMNSLYKAINSNYYYHDSSYYMRSTPITGYAFDVNTGLFYYQTPEGYFKADYVYVSQDGISYDYKLTVKNGEERYFNSYYGKVLDPGEYADWDWVSLSGKKMGIAETYDGNLVQTIGDSSVIENELHTNNFYIEGYQVYYATDRVAFYTISMAPFDELLHHDFFYEYQNVINEIYGFQENIIGLLWPCLLLFIVAVVLLVVSAPEEKERLKFFHKIPVLIFTGAVIAAEIAVLFLMVWFIEAVFYNNIAMTLKNFLILGLGIAFVMLFVGFVYLANIITRIKTKTFMRYSEVYYLSRPLVCMARLAKENASLFWKGIFVIAGISFLELMVLIIMGWDLNNLLICFLLGKMIEIPVVIYVLFQMKQLQAGAKRVASGDLSQPIDTSKMLWEFKKHGENINKVGEGISLAVDEKMKSERFKTELITNVSHDIKTPLTSIINYVDLIKREEITDPTLAEYVEVLDRQSARLKKLIEDLMEASKASTGNIAVHFEECDVDVLLTQLIGEFEDKLEVNGLEVVVNRPERPVIVIADGRHMWRVFDNLMNNICKYSQPNTRVYVSLTQEGQTAKIVFKNISKTALNIPSEQLMQRFVRGDSSRHTEGSGLGLSIAQSLTELMNGSLKLDIDGDLFKVILNFNAIV